MSIFLVLIAILPNVLTYPTDYSSVELSFKRLESGESSGEIVNQCCQREPKYITVGYGISEGEVRIDVGHCRQKCLVPVVKPLKREEFDKYLKKYPDMDPIQIFLSLQSKSSQSSSHLSPTSGETEDRDVIDQSNGHHKYLGLPTSTAISNFNGVSTSCLQSTCLPSTIKRENYYDLSGEVKEVDVIESCDCVSLPHKGCQRIPSMTKVHVDTPYEREVDLGQCLGSCDDDSAEHCLSCRPVRNRTISIDGPNGSHCLDVIDDCQCVGECYRVRKFLKVYDYTHVFEAAAAAAPTLMNNVSIEALFNNENNNNSISELGSGNVNSFPEIIGAITNEDSSMEPLIKVIDIGRCSGSCSDVPVASKCLLWSNTSNGTCLSYLSGGRSKCTPTKFVSHSYTDKFGKKHAVVSVTGCGCR